MNEGELLSGMSADTHACTRAQATAQPLSTVKVAALLSSLQEGDGEDFFGSTDFHRLTVPSLGRCCMHVAYCNMVKKNGSTGATVS